jgi:hypothetical protein
MQQQPHDDRGDETQFRGLLREWQAPETPPSLEQRVLGSRGQSPEHQSPWHRSVWRFLLSGYIRVPVSVACAMAVLLTAAVWRFAVQPPAPCVAAQTVAPENRVARTLPLDRCEHPALDVC